MYLTKRIIQIHQALKILVIIYKNMDLMSTFNVKDMEGITCALTKVSLGDP